MSKVDLGVCHSLAQRSSNGGSDCLSDYGNTEREHVFLDHAVVHWATHVREARNKVDKEAFDAVLEICDELLFRFLTWAYV